MPENKIKYGCGPTYKQVGQYALVPARYTLMAVPWRAGYRVGYFGSSILFFVPKGYQRCIRSGRPVSIQL